MEEKEKKTSRFKTSQVITSNSTRGNILFVLSLLFSVGLVIRVETINNRLVSVESVILQSDGTNSALNVRTDGNDVAEILQRISSFNATIIFVDQTTKTRETKNSRIRVRRSSNSSKATLHQLLRDINQKLNSCAPLAMCQQLRKICLSGPRGPPGQKGERGRRGKRGKLGMKGSLGQSGKQGQKGMMGQKGQKGDKGGLGPRGPQGPPGLKGEPGLSISAPKVMVSPASRIVSENQTSLFHCTAAGNPRPSIVWTGPGGVPLRKGIQISRTGTLQIPDSQFGDNGLYNCKATNILGSHNATVALSVEAPPRFSVKPRLLTQVYEYENASLICKAFGNPTPTVEWSRPFFTFPKGRVLKQHGELTLRELQREDSGFYVCKAKNKLGTIQIATTVTVSPGHRTIPSCLNPGIPNLKSNKYNILISGSKVPAYCDMQQNSKGWTLIARFSNNDKKNWMRDDGHWWYDKRSPHGDTSNPASNTDMISQAFWSVIGTEFKITRSDDPTHIALLVTTGGCLGGQTFRSKLVSYGNFRNSAVWASNRCLGSCSVQFGGRYQSTHGFEQAACDGGIQSRNKIGFWCDWSTGDGSVMMIGGGGSKCSRADHGIGITEADAASFKIKDPTEIEYDFGYEAHSYGNPSSSYSLNLLIR